MRIRFLFPPPPQKKENPPLQNPGYGLNLLLVMAQSAATNKEVLEHNINLLSVGSLCVNLH